MGLNDGLSSKEFLFTNQVSGLNLIATGSLTVGRLANGNGPIFPVSIGSPGTFGAIIQAGSVGTAAGSGGFVALRQPFNSAQYAVILSPFSGTNVQAFASGVQNASSGVNIVGGASGRYHWVAIGI